MARLQVAAVQRAGPASWAAVRSLSVISPAQRADFADTHSTMQVRPPPSPRCMHAQLPPALQGSVLKGLAFDFQSPVILVGFGGNDSRTPARQQRVQEHRPVPSHLAHRHLVLRGPASAQHGKVMRVGSPDTGSRPQVHRLLFPANMLVQSRFVRLDSIAINQACVEQLPETKPGCVSIDGTQQALRLTSLVSTLVQWPRARRG